ncbi:MAG: Phosphoribosylformylglycinamidine cyclo-ligase [Planctomycetes bacterium]|nr:Phosphoribosylformylglycinamidine cyclo-ligase [Planctomycetota bacterium]
MKRVKPVKKPTPKVRTTYRDAGVDIDAKMGAIFSARKAIESTWNDRCVGSFGGFGGLFEAPKGKDLLLCSSTDGVGTKIAVAIAAGKHDTVGRCLTNHCVNDILVQGARPLFLLDYIAVGKMDKDVVAQILSGFAAACRENGCALVGGETAEMPGTYKPGDYDLAGTIVGAVERADLLPRRNVAAGDVLIGLPSSGLHTNGYSLARKVLLEKSGLGIHDRPADLGGASVAEALLAVHRSYAPLLLPLLPSGLVKAMAHITGGGFPDNIPRVLPDGVRAVVDARTWEPLPVFEAIRTRGGVDRDECYRVFNMGMGMVLVASPSKAPKLLSALRAAGETGARVIGKLEKGTKEAVVTFGRR